MTYEFEDVETGERVEIQAPMSESVPIGTVIVLNGRRLRRLLSAEFNTYTDNVYFTSHRFAPNTPGAKYYDSLRRPQFATRREAVEFARRNDFYYGRGE